MIDGRNRRSVFGLMFILLLLLSASGAWAQAATGTIIGITSEGVVTPEENREFRNILFGSFPRFPPRYTVEVYTVWYLTRDFDGAVVPVKAQLFVPQVIVATDAPIFAFASGTTGIPDRCAPSLEQPLIDRLGFYRTNMVEYASQGIVTILPDYVGFNDDSRPQRYHSLEAAGHLMLDAIRAVQNFFTRPSIARGRLRLSGHVFVGGYSQGGHAALAAADLRERYAPEIPLDGVIGFASSARLDSLLRDDPRFAPALFYSFMNMYGRELVNPAEIFRSQHALSLEQNMRVMCVNQFLLHYSREPEDVYAPAFRRALYGGTLQRDFPDLWRILELNTAGLSGHGVPVLSLQGGGDRIVTASSQTLYVDELRQTGAEVDYRVFAGVRHRDTRPVGFQDSVDWMLRIMFANPRRQSGPVAGG